MTTSAQLLRAVLIDPADDLARLAWADALEEEGHPERASCIRRAFQRKGRQGATYRYVRGTWELRGIDGLEFFTQVGPDMSWLLDGVTTDEDIRLVERRGLIDEVHCRLSYWIRHGREVSGHWPVTRVGLTDRTPARERRGWVWRSGPAVDRWLRGSWGLTAALVPDDVLEAGSERLYNRAFPSVGEALAALSLACVNWARGQAELPALGSPG